MLSKLRRNYSAQLLIISLAIALSTLFLGLSAFLSDQTDPFSATFTMRYGEEFGVDITSDSYAPDSTIIPGGSASFDPYLINTGDYDTYVFMEVKLPDQAFSLLDVTSDWHQIAEITDRTVYYYGTSSGLTPLESRSRNDDGSFASHTTAPLCSGISLDPNTSLKKGDYTIEAIGYAIEADGLDATDPAAIWNTVTGDTTQS